MNTAMDELCDHYTDEQLEVIVDFLQRTTEAGRFRRRPRRITSRVIGDPFG